MLHDLDPLESDFTGILSISIACSLEILQV